jgi:toxin ParE1/3/4
VPEVVWSERAESDIEQIALYIGVVNGNPSAADRLLDELRGRAEAYPRQPAMGALHDDFKSLAGRGIVRSFRVKNYLDFYRETPQGIYVLRVLHGRRDYRSLV